jgi:hypothetical protein
LQEFPFHHLLAAWFCLYVLPILDLVRGLVRVRFLQHVLTGQSSDFNHYNGFITDSKFIGRLLPCLAATSDFETFQGYNRLINLLPEGHFLLQKLSLSSINTDNQTSKDDVTHQVEKCLNLIFLVICHILWRKKKITK